MTEYMSTDAEGRPTFTCTEPADASCHVWADCLSTDGCESGDPECEHEKVQHDRCILAEWYDRPDETIEMHMDEHGHFGGPLQPNIVNARIVIEWDECPLWSFAPSSGLPA